MKFLNLVKPLIATLVLFSTVSASADTLANKDANNPPTTYNTVVGEKTFYLPKLVELDNSFKLESVNYSKDQLVIVLLPKSKIEKVYNLGVSIKDKNSEYTVASYAIYDANKIGFSFSNTQKSFTPNSEIKLNILDKTYDIKLAEATDVIKPKESISKNADVSVGYQKTSDGILITTNFVDNNMKLMSVGEPLYKPLKTITDFTNNKGYGNGVLTKPLIGLDKQNNKYEFTGVSGSFPIILFRPNKPISSKIQLQVPSLTIKTNKEVTIPNLKLDIPEVGNAINIKKEFDLIFQKMILDKITRTSNTTAELKFTLNTGVKKDIEIRDVFSSCTNVKKIESTWEGNTCTMVLTIDKNVKETELTIASPYFTINGNWVLDIE